MSFFKKGKFQKLAIFTGALLASGSLWTLSTVPVSAAANQLYLSPATASIQKGSSFSVSLRVNPGTPIDTVNASISFDSTMTLQSIDCSGSPFTPFPSCPTSTASPISFTGSDLGGSVSTDSFVARFNFVATAGSGTGKVSVASGDTASAGNPLGATLGNATITFTTPATTTPTCAAGQTGTYPNCVTPVSGGTSGGSSGGAKANPVKANPTTGSASTPAAPATDASATVSNIDVKFTLATFTTTSKDPSQVYILFGTNKDALTQQTALSELGTSHKVSIDPQLLTPGQTYYYVMVSKSQSGALTQTAVDSFTMNGLTVRVGVFDKNNKPLTAQQVTIHSTPVTAKTDAKGYASFSNIMPGTHQVIYTSGGKTYTKQITVDNTVTTAGDTQTAPVQTISVVYNLTASKSLVATYRWVVLGLLLVVVVVAIVLFSQRKLRFSAPGGTPLGSAPIVVGGPSKSSPISSGTGGSTMPKAIETTQRLNSIPDPNKPAPGSTVGPESSERKQF